MFGIKNGEKNWRNNEDSMTDDVGGGIVHFLASSGGKAGHPPLWGGFFTPGESFG